MKQAHHATGKTTAAAHAAAISVLSAAAISLTATLDTTDPEYTSTPKIALQTTHAPLRLPLMKRTAEQNSLQRDWIEQLETGKSWKGLTDAEKEKIHPDVALDAVRDDMAKQSGRRSLDEQIEQINVALRALILIRFPIEDNKIYSHITPAEVRTALNNTLSMTDFYALDLAKRILFVEDFALKKGDIPTLQMLRSYQFKKPIQQQQSIQALGQQPTPQNHQQQPRQQPPGIPHQFMPQEPPGMPHQIIPGYQTYHQQVMPQSPEQQPKGNPGKPDPLDEVLSAPEKNLGNKHRVTQPLQIVHTEDNPFYDELELPIPEKVRELLPEIFRKLDAAGENIDTAAVSYMIGEEEDNVIGNNRSTYSEVIKEIEKYQAIQAQKRGQQNQLSSVVSPQPPDQLTTQQYPWVLNQLLPQQLLPHSNTQNETEGNAPVHNQPQISPSQQNYNRQQRILAFLQQQKDGLSDATTIRKEAGNSSDYTNDTLTILQSNGYVTKVTPASGPKPSTWQLTEQGWSWNG